MNKSASRINETRPHAQEFERQRMWNRQLKQRASLRLILN